MKLRKLVAAAFVAVISISGTVIAVPSAQAATAAGWAPCTNSGKLAAYACLWDYSGYSGTKYLYFSESAVKDCGLPRLDGKYNMDKKASSLYNNTVNSQSYYTHMYMGGVPYELPRQTSVKSLPSQYDNKIRSFSATCGSR